MISICSVVSKRRVFAIAKSFVDMLLSQCEGCIESVIFDIFLLTERKVKGWFNINVEEIEKKNE